MSGGGNRSTQEETTDLRQVTDKLSRIWSVPGPRIELVRQWCEARWSKTS